LRVEIHNSGTATGSIKSLAITPPNAAYSLGAVPLPDTLKAGALLEVNVTFAPHVGGPQNSSLVLINGGDNSQMSIPITGNATINGAGVEASSVSSGWSLEVSPNPAKDYADLTVTAAKSDVAELRIFDVTGREVRSMPLGMLSIGEHESELSTAGLPNGIYFVRVTGGNGEVCAARLVIER
ncbi:MAG: T9SS type A sorting domain-containing protein, partial [Candidatus Kapaibacterium sp.]